MRALSANLPLADPAVHRWAFGGGLGRWQRPKFKKSLLRFVGRFRAALGSNNRRGNHHTNKCKGNQKVMHRSILLVRVANPVHK